MGRASEMAAVGGATRTAAFTALAAVAPISWGTTYLVTTEFLPPDRPLLSGVLRTLPAGLALLLLTRTLPRGRWWWRSAVLGLLNIGAFNALLFVAAYRLPGGVAATLTSMQPLLIAGLGVVLLGERPTAWRLGWGVAGMAGVALMVLRGEASLDLLGVVAGVAAAASAATGIVLIKRWGQPDGAGLLSFTGWQLAAGGLLFVPLAIVEGPFPELDTAAVGGYAWLAIVATLVAYVLWFQAEAVAGRGGVLPRSALTRSSDRTGLAGARTAAHHPADRRVRRGHGLDPQCAAHTTSGTRTTEHHPADRPLRDALVHP